MSISVEKYKKMIAGYTKETLEQVRAIGHSLIYDENKVELGKNDLYSVAQVAKSHTVPANQIKAISEKMHSEWCVFEGDELNETNLSHLVEAINQELGQSQKSVSIIKKKKNIFLQFSGDKKLYFLSDDPHSRKARLISFLTDPVIGVSKSIDSIIEFISLPDDDFRDMKEKKIVLRNTLREIQRELKNEKCSKTFSFEWRSANTVALQVKDR